MESASHAEAGARRCREIVGRSPLPSRSTRDTRNRSPSSHTAVYITGRDGGPTKQTLAQTVARWSNLLSGTRKRRPAGRNCLQARRNRSNVRRRFQSPAAAPLPAKHSYFFREFFFALSDHTTPAEPSLLNSNSNDSYGGLFIPIPRNAFSRIQVTTSGCAR